MSAAFDLCTYVCVTLGKGTMGGVNGNAFVNDFPATPAALLAVFEYGGSRSHMGMANADPDALENVNCQIRVRNANASTAQATIYSIYKSMDGLGAVTINSVSYLFFRAKQPPFFLSKDGNNLTTFACNFEVQKRRS